MPKLDELWAALMYDATPGERLRVARVMYRFTILLFLCWSVGSFAPAGFAGFARANEVDEKIKAAIDPINAQLAEIKSKELTDIKGKLDEGERIQKRILATQISAQLRDLNRLRCTTSDATVRVRMEQDIEEAEQEYRMLVGERYPLPACKDL